MVLSKGEIFLTFATVVLTVFSIGFGKRYSSEKNEKLRQINLNVQLNAEKERLQNDIAEFNDTLDHAMDLKEQVREAEAKCEELQNQNNQILGEKNDIEVENRRLQEENIQLSGNDLVRLREINNRIEELKNRVEQQLNRDPEAEVPDDPKASNWAMDARRQNAVNERDRVVREINTEIKNLHDEFLRIKLPQIWAEAQVVVYNRHNKIMQIYLNEIIGAEGNLNNRSKIDVGRIRQNTAIYDTDIESALGGINDKIDQELKSRITNKIS